MKKNRQIEILDWLCLNEKISLAKLNWLGPVVTVLGGILTMFVLFLSFVLVLELFFAVLRLGPYSTDTDGSSVRNIGLAVVTLFGAPFLVWRSVIASKQVETSQESLFNQKITDFAGSLSTRRQIVRHFGKGSRKTTFQDWEDDIVARVTAIDGLEGLAFERPDVSPRVVRLLASYIRGTFPCDDLIPSQELLVIREPRMDLQRAIGAIGRVLETAASADKSHWRLDLSKCDLDGVDFSDGFFRAVNFTKCRFEAANFNRANFEGAFLYECLLNYGRFYGTNLNGVRFDYATINQPQPVAGGMVKSINFGTLKGATFISADISALDYIGTEKEISETFGTNETKVSRAIKLRMPDKNLHHSAFMWRYLKSPNELTADQLVKVKELEKTGFQNWTPFTSDDLATSEHLKIFRIELGMNRWPFVGK